MKKENSLHRKLDIKLKDNLLIESLEIEKKIEKFKVYREKAIIVKKLGDDLKLQSNKNELLEKELLKSIEDIDKYRNMLKDISEKDILKIYVDGSYNSSTDDFAYGYVAVLGDIIINVDNGKQPSDKENNTRQVAGELLATLKGLNLLKILMRKIFKYIMTILESVIMLQENGKERSNHLLTIIIKFKI